jgi:hypothetical protein
MPELFQLAFERFPPEPIFADGLILFDAESRTHLLDVAAQRSLDGGASAGDFPRRRMKSGCGFNQEFGSAEFVKDEVDVPGSRRLTDIEVKPFNESFYRGPIFMALGLLDDHQILSGHDVDRLPLEFESRASLPKLRKRVAAANTRHKIYSQARNIRPLAPEMEGMTPVKKYRIERRLRNGDGDRNRRKIVESSPHAIQVVRVNEYQKIQVAAKLSRPVEHARLAAHEERLRATLPHRRKGFEYRAPVQVILREQEKSPIVSRIRENAPAV